ncbi:MAG: ATPase, partial [Gammaproteobacteria bacterium]
VAFPSPRSWEFAHRALKKFDGQPQLLAEALQACVGPAAGIELAAFVDNLDRLPDIDAIVRGESAEVPEETDLQYAVASALVGRAIRHRDAPDAQEVWGRIIEYAGRFPDREMGVMLISDMHRAIGQDLFSVPQFAQWARAVADVMLFDARKTGS